MRVMIICGCSEWITTPTVTYIADTLLRGYGSDADITSLLDTFDVIVCPIINVDGVDYTWAEDGDRMWRKTRSVNQGSKCVGVDPCRNFDYEWAGAGASPVACSDTYYGPSAASEPEVQAVQNYVCGHNDTIKLYINFHSYSQLWLSPWGYTADLPVDYTQQNDGSAVAVKALEAVHGTSYEYGATSDTIYPASGIASDYAYGACGIKYSYTVELRDTGRYGFLLPPDQIVPSGEETLAGVIALANFIAENP
jgi:murein tripeptide amidase MpaA